MMLHGSQSSETPSGMLSKQDSGSLFMNPVNVLPLGFHGSELQRIHAIFANGAAASRQYGVATATSREAHWDILLVNFDQPAALQEKNQILEKAPDTPVVAVSRGPLHDAPAFHLRGMLIAARLLGMLDKIELPVVRAPVVEPETIAELPVEGLEESATSTPSLHVPLVPLVIEPVEKQVAGYRALVVDDSPAIQKSLELYLKAMDGIGAVDFADDGSQALERAQAVTYDLIFLDVLMPGLDGYEACSQLRKMPVYKKTPIIMVSGKTSPLDEVKGVIAGCTTYLTKPVEQAAFEKLSRRVLAWLENFGVSAKAGP